jgi:hypothetical protein
VPDIFPASQILDFLHITKKQESIANSEKRLKALSLYAHNASWRLPSGQYEHGDELNNRELDLSYFRRINTRKTGLATKALQPNH